MMTFSDLQLSEKLLRAIAEAGYTTPTPIQAEAIPYVLMGRDILGCAQTGTGKTASFTLPMIDILAAGRAKARMPRSLILEPTRELAAQVAENFDTFGKHHSLRKVLLIGGESMAEQVKILDRGADVLICTPGRLLDVFDRGYLLLNDVRILVIDEADRMLDMGFIPDVERIAKLVSRVRQTLFFSATMPPPIRRLADAFLTNPKEIIISPPATPAENVEQGIVVVAEADGLGTLKAKRAALRALIRQEEVRNALIFCNRKREVGVVCRSLQRHGFDAAMLHGDMPQASRTETLDRFRRNEVRLLVCSDVAARGLDIQDLSHVFNFDVPTNPEDYIHRIGRTARAGRSGRALTIAAPSDAKYVALIEQMLGQPIPHLQVEGVPTGSLEAPTSKGGRRRRASPAPSSPRARSGAGPRASPPPAGPRPSSATPPPATGRSVAPRAAAGTSHPLGGRTPSRSEPREAPVIGMGDHVPAFLLREVKTTPKKG